MVNGHLIDRGILPVKNRCSRTTTSRSDQLAVSACAEVTDHSRNLFRMGLKREVACIKELDCGAWNIARAA
jgi:hypothetical protein